MAIAIQAILKKHKKVHFWDDDDAQKEVVNEIDDYFYDELSIELSLDQMDKMIEKVLQVARHRNL